MKYQIRKKGEDCQLVLHEGNFILSFTGKDELKELIKYAKIAIGMENDPRKPRADLHIVK